MTVPILEPSREQQLRVSVLVRTIKERTRRRGWIEGYGYVRRCTRCKAAMTTREEGDLYDFELLHSICLPWPLPTKREPVIEDGLGDNWGRAKGKTQRVRR